MIRDFWDFLFGCAEITVNVGGTPVPRPPSDFKGLDLNYNPATGWITGDVTGLGSVCDTGTQDQTAKVCISVSTGANEPIEVTRTDDVFRLDPVAGITCTVNDCALREALAIADDGDTIRFRSGGVYDLKAHPALSEIGHIVLSKRLKIEGPATGTPVVLNQTEPGVRVFEISGTGDVELENLTIMGGEAGATSVVASTHSTGAEFTTTAR